MLSLQERFSFFSVRIRLLILLCFLLAVQTSYALPFSVVTKAGTTLPTTFSSTAFYTVTNNTQSQRNQSFVKYFPPNTTQVTSGGTFGDTCGVTFNLAAHGQAGDSCTLQLTVSGVINGNDPNPHNHLFVCFPGGTTCAGTPNPLNVGNQPFNIGVYVTEASANNDVLGCEINANGSLGHCVLAGSGFNTPSKGAINPAGTFLYVNNGGSNTISYCAIQIDRRLTNCQTALSSVIQISSFAFNPAGTFVYIVTEFAVSRCTVNSDGSLSSCLPTGNGFFQPVSITLNPQGTFAYVGSANHPGFIASVCTVNSDGTLSSCHNTGSVMGSGVPYPIDIAVNATNTFFYAADADIGNNITFCSINSITGDLNACVATVNGLNSPEGLALNSTNTFAYVSNTLANQVLYCLINTDGSLSNCLTTGTTFSQPVGIILFPTTA